MIVKIALKKKILIHVISPLITGGLLYVLFRSTTLRMFHWFEFLGLKSCVSILRQYVNPIKSSIPSWVYFSLPDGLWVYSFTSIILIIWHSKITLWVLIPFSSGVIVEILQKYFITGTFDWLDFIFSIIGFFLSIFILNKNKKNHVQVF